MLRNCYYQNPIIRAPLLDETPLNPLTSRLFENRELLQNYNTKLENVNKRKIISNDLKKEIIEWQDDLYILTNKRIDWFLNLEVGQKQEHSQIQQQQLIHFILYFHQKAKLKVFKFSNNFDLSPKSRLDQRYKFLLVDSPIDQHKLSSEEFLINSARIACTGTEKIFFTKESLISGQVFLKHLENISQNQIFEYSQKQEKKNEVSDNPLWFSRYSFNSLGEWMCSSIQKSILNRYFNMKRGKLLLSSSLLYGNKLLQFYSKLQNSEKKKILPLSNIKFLINQKVQLRNIFNLKLEEIKLQHLFIIKNSFKKLEQLYHDSQNEIRKQNIKKKCIKSKKKVKKIKINSNQNTSQSDGNFLAEDSFYNKNLEQSNTIQLTKCTINQPQYLNKCQKILQENESSYIHLTQSIIQNFQDISANKNFIQQETPEKIEKQSRISNYQFPQNQTNNQNRNEQGSISELKQIHQQSINSRNDQKENLNKKIQYQNNQERQSTVSHQQTQVNSTTDSVEVCKKNIKKKHKKKKKSLSQVLTDTIFNNFLDPQVQKFVDNISINSNKLLEARIVVFQRIRYFIMKLYGQHLQVDAKLFGSNAIGLALPSSDIDILLTGFKLQTKQDSIDLLQKISNYLQRMRWIVSCVTYLHAKIPIIKLEIDPNIGFFQMHQYQEIPIFRAIRSNLQISSKVNAIIKVDITIEARLLEYSHQGCESTQFMKQCINEIQELNPLILLLKHIFAQHGFNESYKGGISSYSTFLMVAAFLKQYHNQQQQKGIGQLFYEMLKFYSQQFQNEYLGLSYYKDKQCFFKINQMQNNSLLNIIQPIHGRLISGSCSQYNLIKYELKKIKDSLDSIKQMIKKDVKNLSHTEIKGYVQKKKNIDKWIKKYEKIQNMLLQSIINN